MTRRTRLLRWWLELTGSSRVFRTVRFRIKNVQRDAIIHALPEVVAGINRQLKSFQDGKG